MKKIIVLVAFLITNLCFVSISSAEPSVVENDEVRLYIDGKQCEYNSSLIISNESFLSPMEMILSDLGITNDNEHIIWSSDRKSVSIIKDKININLIINSRKAKVNGKEIMLNASPVIYKGNVYIPLRFIAESLGGKVSWGEESKSIFIYDNVTANKVKDYITKAFSTFRSSDKYKLTMKENHEYNSYSEEEYTIFEIDRKKNLSHFQMYETRNNTVTSNETYLYNNLLFNRSNDGKWIWIESNNDKLLNSIFSDYLKLNFVESDSFGFSLNDQNTDQVILKSYGHLNRFFGKDVSSSNIEIVINKKTGTFEKISLNAYSTDDNMSVVIELNGFDFEISVPDEVTGAILVEEEKYDEALLHYDKSIQNHPDNVQLYVAKIEVLRELNRLDEALTTCDRFINLKAENSTILMAKAEILVDLERLEEALQCYDKVIKLDPSNYEVYSEKAHVLISLDRLDEALECLNTASDMLEQSLQVDEE